MSRNLAKYALQLADDAKKYKAHPERPTQMTERVAYVMEYEATDTAFSVLEEVVKRNPFLNHGMELVKDEEHHTETLILDDDTHIERSYDEENEEPFNRIYSLTRLEGEERPDIDKLLDTLLTQVDDLMMIGDLDFGGPDAKVIDTQPEGNKE